MDKEFRLKDGLHVSGNAAIIGSITTVDSVQFNLTHNVTNGIGMLDWSVDDSTIELGLTPNVTLQVGQEQLYLVKNQSGADIPDGTAVMSVGTIGASGRILVAPAIANGSVASKRVMGVTTERIADGADGFVSYFGKIRGLNTSMWSKGDILYVSSSTPGALSNTQPVAPNNKVTLAFVISKHANNGTIFVRPTFGSAISEDENVHIDTLLDGQLLIWNSTTGRFENKTYTGYQANDYNTYTTLTANDYNTLLSARSNDYNTLLSAYSNDGSTLLTARSNDFSTWSGLNAYVNLKANNESPVFTGYVEIRPSISSSDASLSIYPEETSNTSKLYLHYSNTGFDSDLFSSSNANLTIDYSGTRSFIITNASQPRIAIDQTGRVGINKIPTSAELDVEGSIQVTEQLKSTVPDIAPLEVVSTTLVTNLNADYLDGVHLSAIQLGYAANDYNTLLSARANDGATLLTARANDFSTWNGLNAYINLKANTAGPTFTGDVTIADKIIHSGDTNTAIRFPAADTFTVETSGLERIRVDSAGNFGIGTTPTVKLHLYDGNTAISLNEVASGGSGVASWRLKHGLNHYGAYVSAANALVFYDYGATAERMRLDNLGNLGIGVISPAQRLDVSGNVKISGGIVANNSLGSASQVLTSNGSGIYWSTPTTGSTAYSATIGNGSANTFIITHNLGTQNIFTSIRDTATNYFVYPDIKYNNTNSITIEFSSVPTANSYYVAILGA